jgi:glyoxylase-like metal-dependent hydrolase (beta-lactamase superfamily II)
VQKVFGTLFNAEPGFARDGSQFDVLFVDEEGFRIGNLHARALHTPGIPPACMSYMSRTPARPRFVGDTLFMPDYGTARCDFPGASDNLYQLDPSAAGLPDQTRLFMCHDYLPGGRELRYVTTVAEQRADNIHMHEGVSQDSFVAMREARDKTSTCPC